MTRYRTAPLYLAAVDTYVYGCAKRGCDAVNPDYLSFGADGVSYCLHHIPWRYRVKVWWQERRCA